MYNPNIANSANAKTQIGNLTYDPTNQCLSTFSETVYLRNKLNEVLFHMVSNHNRVISRDELIEKVWNGNYYTGVKGVTHSISKLRKALNDLGVNDIQIHTYPKQGYVLAVN